MGVYGLLSRVSPEGTIRAAVRRSVVRATLAAAVLSSVAPALSAPTAGTSGSGVCARDDRPSIGLVLSGGGARGGAHIGVLEAPGAAPATSRYRSDSTKAK